MRTLLLAALVFVGLGACKPKVDFQTYCQSTGTAFCTHCAPGLAMQACLGSFVTSCIGTRGATNRTNANTDQMNACAAALMAADCNAVIAGNLPPACNNN